MFVHSHIFRKVKVKVKMDLKPDRKDTKHKAEIPPDEIPAYQTHEYTQFVC